MSAHSGFIWPEQGPVSAPDWRAEARCGNGLHGLLWGQGSGDLLNWSEDAKWLVVEVPADSVVELDGKVKFPSGEVVYCGNREGATQLIAAKHDGPIVGLTAQSNARTSTIAVGYRGTATAGEGGTATAGTYGTATAGNYGTATAGEGGTATAGNYGTATAGYRGTATAGYRGTATAGEGGTATAGNYGTATAGNYGTATAGNYGTATAGEGGVLELSVFDGKRTRKVIAYVGEAGIKADTKYRLDGTTFVEVPVLP